MIFLCSFFISNAEPRADTLVPKKSEFALVAYAGAGLSYYLQYIGTPAGAYAHVNRVFPDATLRIMWHPDHRLRLGVETGFAAFYSYKFVDKDGNKASLLLTGIPMLVVWSMPLGTRFNVFGGLGAYMMTSHLNYLGEVKSSTFSLGWSAAVSYVHPLSNRLSLGTEIKLMRGEETSDSVLSLQIQLVYKFLKW